MELEGVSLGGVLAAGLRLLATRLRLLAAGLLVVCCGGDACRHAEGERKEGECE